MISIYNEGWINKRYRTREGLGFIQRKGEVRGRGAGILVGKRKERRHGREVRK
jgi:hypothetical protein